jgi:hypothetical protein
MRHLTIAFVAGCLAFPRPVFAEHALGKAPLCEASAALLVEEADKPALLVGDNELNDRIFRFKISDDHHQLKHQRQIAIASRGTEEISDIEALGLIAPRRLLVFGSHSRDNKCERKPKRLRFMMGTLGADRIKDAQVVQTDKISCSNLFHRSALNDKLTTDICQRVDEVEHAADQAAGNERACQRASAFNAEGALVVSSTEVWIGLRAPLLPHAKGDSQIRDLAILLRLNDLEHYRFNGSALLDLNGRGIRDMTLRGDTIWGIAGPAEDRREPFLLWRFPRSELRLGATIRPEIVMPDLPPSSEGLALSESHLYVVMDGDQPLGDAHECRTSAGYAIYAISNLGH